MQTRGKPYFAEALHPMVPFRLRNQRPYLAALSAFLLAQLFAGNAAAQGCNTAANPTPPNVTIPNVNGQTFGPAPTPTFLVDLRGADG